MILRHVPFDTGFNVMTAKKLPEMDQKSFLASPSYNDGSWSRVEEDDSLWRLPCSSPRSGRSQMKVAVLRTWSPPESFTVPSAIGNLNFSPLMGCEHFLCIEFFCVDFRCVRLFQFLNVCDQDVSFPDSLPRATHVLAIYLARLLDRTDAARHFSSRDRVIFDHRTKRAIKWYSEPPLIWCLQIAAAFHGIRPPFIVQTWLHQYRRCPFLDSAHCSLSNPMSFRSVRRWRTLIPRKIFTGFAQF